MNLPVSQKNFVKSCYRKNNKKNLCPSAKRYKSKL